MDAEFMDTVQTIGIALVFLLLVVDVIIRLAKEGVPAADERLASGIQDRLSERERIAHLEKMYTHAGSMAQGSLNVMAEVIKVLAPMTPLKSDDELAKLLEDIRNPGPPAQEVGADVGKEAI